MDSREFQKGRHTLEVLDDIGRQAHRGCRRGRIVAKVAIVSIPLLSFSVPTIWVQHELYFEP